MVPRLVVKNNVSDAGVRASLRLTDAFLFSWGLRRLTERGREMRRVMLDVKANGPSAGPNGPSEFLRI